MRKMISFFLAVTMVFGMGLTCYAGEMPLSEAGGTATGDVYARYVSAAVREAAPVENGTAEVILDDGRTVVVTGAPGSAVIARVVFIPSTETEAWKWFSDCLDREIIDAFEVYFQDADGNRINADGVRIEITSNGAGKSVFSVTIDGKTAELKSEYQNGRLEFTANGGQYYVLAEKNTSGGSDTSGEADSDEIVSSPQTGDDITTWLSFVTLLLSGMLLICLVIRKRNERHP